MEMMQRMMGQGGNPMEMMPKMMGMCFEMFNAMRETNEWLGQVEEKALAALKEGEKDAAALGAVLGISEERARHLLAGLAASGKITLAGRYRT